MTNRGPGQHPLYKPEYCDLVIELGKQGMLPVRMAPRCGVQSRQSLHDWAKKYPEFSYAFNMARLWCEDYWLNLLQKKANGKNPQADASTIKFMLSAAFGYREKTDQSIEIEGNLHSSKSPLVLSFRDAKIKD